MKILYIAKERSDAEVSATALRGIAQNVTVLWASHVDRAAKWIDRNRDLAALVVEATVDIQSCTSFLTHVRSLGLRAAVVVIAPEEALPRLESVQAGAYDYVAKNQSLLRDLPVVVKRAIERAQMLDPGRWDDPHFESAANARVATMAARDALAQTLAETLAALDHAERARASDAAAAADRLEHCQAEFDARVADIAGSKSTLERRLGDLEASFQQLEQSWAGELSAAAERQTKLDGLLHQERAMRANLEQKLTRANAALQEAEQRHQSAMTTAAEQLAERQAQYEVGMVRAAATWEMVDEQLRDATIEVKRAREDQASAAADVDRLLRRDSERSLLLAELTSVHSTLKTQLADAQAALEAANERTERERSAAAEQAAGRHTEFQTQLEQEGQRRRSIEERLAHAGTARDDAEARHASAMTTAAALFAEREAQLDAALTEAASARDALARQARDLEAALALARQDLESSAAATERLTRREAELTAMLAESATTHNTLERRLAGTESAFKDADERATRERLAATRRAAEREAELDGQLRQERVSRANVEQKLAEVESALSDAEQRHALATTTAAVDVERLAQREAELASRLAGAAATRITLERQLIDTTIGLRDADERATLERAVATQRQLDVEMRLSQEIKRCETLEGEIAETRSAAEDAERRFREETAAMAARAREHAARLEDQIASERLEQESRLSELEEQVRNLALERDALHESLRTSNEQSQRTDTEHRAEREGLERARVTAEAEVRRLVVEHTEAQHNLEEARRNFQQTLDRDSSEHASARAALLASAAERDAQMAARNREIEQLRGNLKATIHELDVTRSRHKVLQTEADRVPLLQKQLDDSRTETLRQFEDSPLALCRCTRDGALTHANRAFAVLVDYRKADELRSADFATTVFESPDDLSWLIERCLSTRAIEAIETTWRGINGSRLVVRLSAFASASEVIEIVVEDLTNLRALQDRLDEARRMEAVGRLASEVAVTCGNLLLDVHQGAQQWLMTVGDNTALQHRGEMLLEEVTRAANHLRQLAAYSDEETSALAPVDLNSVLRDLEPVLKRVAGDDVELELPKASSGIDVDVKAERVERLLVNLAGYGRARMPLGGRLRIELATVVVDHRFIAKYPNVRQGPHALITVTEVKRAIRAEGQLQLRAWPTAPRSDSLPSEKPGVDLGALQGLIRECGGHLWMAVEPPGDMVVKIHLPMRASDDRTPPRTSINRTSRGRTIGRWFHH